CQLKVKPLPRRDIEFIDLPLLTAPPQPLPDALGRGWGGVKMWQYACVKASTMSQSHFFNEPQRRRGHRERRRMRKNCLTELYCFITASIAILNHS
ncbi:MAG: hypothetical protein ACYTXC_18060, partial [Nostoc sp.]